MRILMLTSSYPKYPGDGTAPFVEGIARAVARRGHSVDLVLPRHPELVTVGRDGGLDLRLLPFWAGPARARVWGYASSMRADRSLRGAALVVAPLAAGSALLALRRRLAAGRYDLVHAHWALPNGAIAVRAARARDVPVVVSVHGSDVFLAERNGVFRAVGRLAFTASRWITACSRDLLVRAQGLGAPPERSVLLPYGVDPEALAGGDPAGWRERCRAGPRDVLVVGIGRLVAKKGFAYLIRATALLVRWGLAVRTAIAGTGDLASVLAREAGDTGCLDRVCLLGEVPHREVGALLRAADAVVVPSVRDEVGNVDGLPNVLLEAIAVGRPVVASRVAGIPDVVEDGRDALLVPPGDVQALATALRKLIEDRSLAEKLAAAAARTARSFTWDAYGARLEQLYREAVETENR